PRRIRLARRSEPVVVACGLTGSRILVEIVRKLTGTFLSKADSLTVAVLHGPVANVWMQAGRTEAYRAWFFGVPSGRSSIAPPIPVEPRPLGSGLIAPRQTEENYG